MNLKVFLAGSTVFPESKEESIILITKAAITLFIGILKCYGINFDQSVPQRIVNFVKKEPMRLLFFTALIGLSGISSAQVFWPSDKGFVIYADTNFQKPIQTTEYDACWCDVWRFSRDTSNINHYLVPKQGLEAIPVRKNGKWGAIDKNGKVVIDFNYEGPVIPLDKARKGVLLNTKVEKGSAAIDKETILEIRDTSTSEPEKYFVQDEYKGHLLVSQDEEFYGIMNEDLKIILPIKYRPILYTKERFYFNPSGLLTLKTSLEADSKCGMVDYTGKVIFPFKYDFISDYVSNEDAIFVQINDNRGFVDRYGHTKLPMRFKTLPYVLTDTMLIADDHYTWFISKDYSIVGNKKYQSIDKKDSLYFFKRDGKWGVMNEKLEVIIPNKYASITDAPRMRDKPEFKAYVVIKDQKYGVISLTGEVIIPCEYECNCSLSYFSPDDFFIEFKNGNTSYKFDETGKLIEKGPSENERCLCEIY